MSTSRSRRSVASTELTATDASLHSLAEGLLASLAEGGIEPALLHVADTDEPREGELGFLPLDGRHPTELLLGFTAPEHWRAVGIATRGWAYHVDDRAHADRSRRRVHVVSLVSRSGEGAHRVCIEGDDELGSGIGPGDMPTGEQIDLLHRVLGLPTDPPPCPSAAYWGVDWLSAVLATEPDQVASWDAVCDRHPARRILADLDRSDPIIGDAAAHDFAVVVRAFARVCSWASMRQAAADDRFAAPELTADDAAWLDDGAFARFVLNRCPPLSMLRQQAIDHLPGHLAEQLIATLGRAGVPRAAWPDDLAA